MYFLSDEERKKLLHYYLPKARREGVAEELRGWNWSQPPLSPVYDCPLGVFEVASGYCSSSRDVYLRRVEGARSQPNGAMFQGALLHGLIARLVVATKRLIYGEGVDGYREILRKLQAMTVSDLLDASALAGLAALAEAERQDLERKSQVLLEFERGRLIARLQEALVKQPYIGEDALSALAVPVVVEQKLDGSFLGLSPHLSADAYNIGQPMIVEVKFGEPRDFHRLATAGYALVMEAVYEHPVDVGCLVYATFKGDRVIIRRDIHLIDDELRQWFVEARDEKARMIYEEIDPGLAKDCPQACPFASRCS
ncbi:type I-A CRISPR-associated protein Cas4/Csa1 [Heliobacterium gestii]|uniref:Type I-A CRISPR-associated protein Cas4/Csa1 n=1 Tax=Heliomicrobium gestii TaxID=2699 RepID=A0A845L4Z4_HELGE|nr:type I-A CRISPR-associated protein Cas4/Csa1 [Heliomicrobium gestii]MBM7865398.1 CRISPR-associated protein Csa1 [Heliomicrobium gestii]MZP41657.1 type I-A CRISPR-associated protein Cas4/Csa1 [Heliomicrobium gestii]